MNKSVGENGVNVKRSIVECSYGVKCDRKTPGHFEKFTHSHLDELLKFMGEEIVIPSDYEIKIRPQILIEQLELIRKSRKSVNSFTKVSDSTSKSVQSCSICYSPLPTHKERNDNISEGEHKMNSCKNNYKKDYSQCDELENHKRDAIKRAKITVHEKMKAVYPYNIFLTVVKDSPGTFDELTSISFSELLDPYFGELESSLQLNSIVNLEFLLRQYNIMGHRSKPLTLLYNNCFMEFVERFDSFLKHAKVTVPTNFGSHHTKMMVFRYTDGSVRIVLLTANLVEKEWLNRTQGLWISPKCPLLPPSSGARAGESVTNFKQDFLQYLSSYNLSVLSPWLRVLQDVDMSLVKVFFVASIPGTHHAKRQDWGQLKLSKILSEQVVPNDGKVIAQCSSIGSFGPKPSSWLLGEMLSVFTSSQQSDISSPSPMSLVYPSFECISKSFDGLLGGRCILYSQATHAKQKWLLSHLCDWCSEKRHRTRAPPHIKSYCRVSKDEKRMHYFVLTSANMSKAAWGFRIKSGSLIIRSYEAGILLVPQILIGQDYFPLVKEDDSTTNVFSLPYDLPLVPYSSTCEPWFIDNLYDDDDSSSD